MFVPLQFEASWCGVHEGSAWKGEHYSPHCQSGLSHSKRDKEAEGPGELTVPCFEPVFIIPQGPTDMNILPPNDPNLSLPFNPMSGAGWDRAVWD